MNTRKYDYLNAPWRYFSELKESKIVKDGCDIILDETKMSKVVEFSLINFENFPPLCIKLIYEKENLDLLFPNESNVCAKKLLFNKEYFLSLLRFTNNEFKLQNVKTFPEFEGKYYSELPNFCIKRIDKTMFRIIDCTTCSNEELEFLEDVCLTKLFL